MAALERYADVLRITEELVENLYSGLGEDEKIQYVEQVIRRRQAILEDIEAIAVLPDELEGCREVLTRIADMDKAVHVIIGDMMEEYKAGIEIIQRKRSQLNQSKRARNSYVGLSSSSGGYFIDSKK